MIVSQILRVVIVPENLATFTRDNLFIVYKAKKEILFVSCNGLEKKVGRSVKKNFLHYFFGQKCVFYA